MKCFFCGHGVLDRRSSLDSAYAADIWELICTDDSCGLHYHFEGTLKATGPDLSSCDETKVQIRELTEQGTSAVLFSKVNGGVTVKKHRS